MNDLIKLDPIIQPIVKEMQEETLYVVTIAMICSST